MVKLLFNNIFCLCNIFNKLITSLFNFYLRLKKKKFNIKQGVFVLIRGSNYNDTKLKTIYFPIVMELKVKEHSTAWISLLLLEGISYSIG